MPTHSSIYIRGFSLIELLVVISIISVLVGILLPSLRLVREAAKNTQCTANVRQINLAMPAYLADNSEWFPGEYDPSPSWNVRTLNWFGGDPDPAAEGGQFIGIGDAVDRPLNPYLTKYQEIALCPFDAGDTQTEDNGTTIRWTTEPSAYVNYGTSYAASRSDYSQFVNKEYRIQAGVWNVAGHRQTEISQPTKKVWVHDLPGLFNRRADNEANHWHNDAGGNIFTADPLVTYGYLDGHVEQNFRGSRNDMFNIVLPVSGLDITINTVSDFEDIRYLRDSVDRPFY